MILKQMQEVDGQMKMESDWSYAATNQMPGATKSQDRGMNLLKGMNFNPADTLISDFYALEQ